MCCTMQSYWLLAALWGLSCCDDLLNEPWTVSSHSAHLHCVCRLRTASAFSKLWGLYVLLYVKSDQSMDLKSYLLYSFGEIFNFLGFRHSVWVWKRPKKSVFCCHGVGVRVRVRLATSQLLIKLIRFLLPRKPTVCLLMLKCYRPLSEIFNGFKVTNVETPPPSQPSPDMNVRS